MWSKESVMKQIKDLSAKLEKEKKERKIEKKERQKEREENKVIIEGIPELTFKHE